MTMTSNCWGLATNCIELWGMALAQGQRWLSGNVRVIDDHIIESNSRGLVLLSNATECVKEQAVTELHNVGFVDASNFLFRDVSAR
jgi:hypothetical protein